MRREPDIDLSPTVSDAVKFTTCYMCACRCGIKVHLRDGQVRHIEGNRNHPVNKGVLCGKGASGIMQHYSPARLRKPLKRVGERGKSRVRRDRMGRGAGDRHAMAVGHSPQRPQEARVLHRARPEPVADRLVGLAIRHAELRRAWRILLGQHGRRRSLHDRRLVLGVRRTRLGPRRSTSCCSASRKTMIPIRSRRAWPSSRRAAPRSSRSIRSAPAIPRSPTSGSAFARARMVCSFWR